LEANVVTLELVPLASMTATFSETFVLEGTPAGGRYIFEVGSVEVEGERVRATLKGRAAADWLVVGPDGTGTLDVRALLETHDGALVYAQYNGRVDLAAGGGAPRYATPRFETGDERYRWLNKIQAVGKGAFDGTTLVYELFELK
jgi:hypothetical protein